MGRVEFVAGPLDAQWFDVCTHQSIWVYRDSAGVQRYDEDFIQEGPNARRIFRYTGANLGPYHEGAETVTLDELTERIVQWGFDRRITVNSTPQAQTLKMVSEAGELADAVLKNNEAEIEDAIGDVFVTLVMVAATAGLSVRTCVEGAYNQIKDRRGTLTPEGVFVKEEA